MPLRRREEILEVCRRWSRHHSIYLIDDVAYRELRYEAEDVPSFLSLDPHGEHVIVAGTFSKSYAPGVRVGWGILPHELRQAVEDLKANIDFGSPNLNQHLMHQVLQLGCFDRHVQTIRQVYRTKRDAMLSAAQASLASLAGVTWIHPRGGLYLWVTLPEDIDTGPDGMLFDLAVRQGVLYVPGQYTYPVEGNPGKRNTMRLSYGVQPPHRIAEGMELLGQAIREAISA